MHVSEAVDFWKMVIEMEPFGTAFLHCYVQGVCVCQINEQEVNFPQIDLLGTFTPYVHAWLRWLTQLDSVYG